MTPYTAASSTSRRRGTGDFATAEVGDGLSYAGRSVRRVSLLLEIAGAINRVIGWTFMLVVAAIRVVCLGERLEDDE